MNAIYADAKNVQVELMKTRNELQQAEEMMRFVEPDFTESQCLLIESLKSKLSALIKLAKKIELEA